jgi:hypothetical protein
MGKNWWQCWICGKETKMTTDCGAQDQRHREARNPPPPKPKDPKK